MKFNSDTAVESVAKKVSAISPLMSCKISECLYMGESKKYRFLFRLDFIKDDYITVDRFHLSYKLRDAIEKIVKDATGIDKVYFDMYNNGEEFLQIFKIYL